MINKISEFLTWEDARALYDNTPQNQNQMDEITIKERIKLIIEMCKNPQFKNKLIHTLKNNNILIDNN